MYILNNHRPRNPALDSLRGLGVTLVMAYHVATITFIPSGLFPPLGRIFDALWIGVDIFFVLSGYLITTGLITGRSSPAYYRDFYIKRSFRLLPVYYAAFFLFLAVPWVRHTHPGLPLVLCYFFYLQNWAMASGYWIKGTAHLWSLAIEEQFYLVWPWIARRVANGTFLRISISVSVGSLLLRVGLRYFTHITPWALYTLTVTRLDGIALGSAIALLHARTQGIHKGAEALRRTLRLYIRPLFWLTLAALSLLIAVLNTSNANRTAVTWLPFAASAWSACAILYILEFQPVASGFINRLLQRFGLYSYSIYIFHPFVMPLFYLKTGKLWLNVPAYLRSIPAVPAALVTIAVFLGFFAGFYGLGALIYRFFERPLFHLRNQVLRRSDHARIAKAA